MPSSSRYVQKDSGGGHAWSVSPEAASEYLRARMPYPKYLIDYVFAYHQHWSGQYDACLDLGCGPGQLALFMSQRFKKVYGRDPSEQMLKIAKILPSMGAEELQEIGLSKPPSGSAFDFAAGTADRVNLPDDSVDMIIIGSAAHWFDWSSRESSQKIWQEWTRILRKNGTVMVISTLPSPGNWTGNHADQTRPLRNLIRSITIKGELSKYYTRVQAEVGSVSMCQLLTMPWDLGDAETLSRGWDRLSRLFVTFDMPDDVVIEGYEKVQSDRIPDWLPSHTANFIATSGSGGDGFARQDTRWNTTTGRKMAAWLRSASAYVHHLRDNPLERLRIGRDDDLAARIVKQACQEGGLEYDEIIELHQSASVLALKRSDV